jgi:hypothetical protein
MNISRSSEPKPDSAPIGSDALAILLAKFSPKHLIHIHWRHCSAQLNTPEGIQNVNISMSRSITGARSRFAMRNHATCSAR